MGETKILLISIRYIDFKDEKCIDNSWINSQSNELNRNLVAFFLNIRPKSKPMDFNPFYMLL